MSARFSKAAVRFFKCREEDYPKALFAYCLYNHARPVAWLLPSRFFAPDWELIDAVANATSYEEVILITRSFRALAPEERTLRYKMRLRISTRKLARLV